MDKEKVVKIVRPERVERILERVCHARLEVLVRIPNKPKVAVRARAQEIVRDDGVEVIKLTDISDQGIRYLRSVDFVQVEFVGMSTQILFKSKLSGVDGATVRVVKPRALISYDRRSNARYASTPQHMGFVKMHVWQPRPRELTSGPVLTPFEDLASWLTIADISEGGFCVMSRFPSVLDVAENGVLDKAAEVIFPMRTPLACPLEVRWVRRIKDAITIDGDIYNQRIYKFGIQFLEPTSELQLAVKQFIHQLSVSEAI